ncbi:hypothetical protein FRC06_007202 [Ceratobasidium sp. 370]|nr:hypothetical protein FRC06_007202 [Ceratobasidium sp. 370]
MNASRSGDRWAIGLAPRALKELQKFKRDRSSLDIVWKKVKELSSGQFTPDNHTAIIGTTPKIPIYRVRLSNDLRMIYHVDLVPDKGKEFDHQAYLYRKYQSSEYRDRCMYRLPMTSSENNVYLPSKFPHAAHVSDAFPTGNGEDGDDDELAAIAGDGNNTGDEGEPDVEPKAPPTNVYPLGMIKPPPEPDPKQYEIVNHRGATIVVGRSGTGKTTALIHKMHGVEQCRMESLRQLFVTRSRVLAKHVESGFRRLVDSANMGSEAPEEPIQNLLEYDNEIDLRNDLPSRFTLLEESHFPLFISFDKLCSLIEEDIREDERKQGRYVRSTSQPTIIGYKSNRLGLNSSLVYSEILGVIKGYAEVMGCTDGYLNREQYILGSIAHKVTAHLDDKAKTQIYSMFESYRKLKGTRFELDQADRSHHIFKFFTQNEPEGQSGSGACQASIDCLYVDEVQDNLMTDIRLLRGLCKNVENTYWGGDTAQTILAGSAFRIKDLGSYLYTEVFNRAGRNQRRLPTKSAPEKFELTINYRSHEGIVGFAASIVDSLYNIFPGSLDRLDRETADDKSADLLPVVLTGTSLEVSEFENFLSRLTSSIGAQQAILVRSEELAEQLSSRVSQFCPILTITNSKGLEFDDILLYNFFAESDSPSDWRFVHGLQTGTRWNERDSTPSLSLCNELKLLYVAITRARQRCLIWDHGHVIDAMMTVFAVGVSGPAQWIQKGREYFANEMYNLAVGCFKRGGSEAETDYRIAMAYDQMSGAKLEMLRNDTEDTRKRLRAVAQELGDCASLVRGQSARHLWFHAATCLKLAHRVLESADAFVNAELYDRAIRTLLDSNHVKHGAKLLLAHGHNLEPQVKEELLDDFRRHFFENYEYGALPPLFDNNIDNELSFAREHAYQQQLKYLLEHHKRFDELAHVHLEEKALVTALDWFLRAFQHHQMVSSLNEGASVVISYAEWIFTLEGKRSRQEELENLKPMIQKLVQNEAKLEPRYTKALHLFRTMIHEPLNSRAIGDWDENDSEERLRKALVLHEVLRDMAWLSNRMLSAIIPRLTAWAAYSTITSKIVEATEPSRLVAARRLFGFKPPSSDLHTSPSYIVAEGSLVAQCAAKYHVKPQRNAHNELLVPARWVDKIIKDEYRAYLSDKLYAIYSGLIRSGWTSLYVFKPHVRLTGSSAPISRAVTSDLGFKNRLGVTALALGAFAPVCHVPFKTKPSDNPSLLQLWVRHLFDIVYPVTGIFEEFTSPGQSNLQGARACIRQFSMDISLADLSTFVIANSLAMQLESHSPNTDPILHPAPGILSENRLLEKYMIDAFFNWEEVHGLTVVNFGLSEILQSSEEPLDAAVLVHLVELITCEMLYHMRATHSDHNSGFSELILPYSWARMLAKRYANSQILRDTSSLEIFLEVVSRISDGLGDREGDRWKPE